MKSLNHHATGRAVSLRHGVVLLAALTSFGCYKTTFVEDPTAVEKDPTHDEWSHHFAWGIIGNNDYDAGEMCPNGTSVVRTGGNFGTGVATVGTLGIYSPRKVYVTCADARTASK